jgi:hypothetical protein
METQNPLELHTGTGKRRILLLCQPRGKSPDIPPPRKEIRAKCTFMPIGERFYLYPLISY